MVKENIFLFVPNIIGYIRVLLIFVSSCFWLTHPLTVAFLFILSQFVLDDLDGIAARHFKQATQFGGTLDILIDRCSFMVFLMGLCVLYPKYMIVFQLIAYLDMSRMWMKMYSSAILGFKNHKATSGNKLLDFYYTELGLHIFSYGSELFFVALYLLYFSTGPSVSIVGYEIGLWQALAAISFPLVCIKQPINLMILKIGCQDIVATDSAKRAAAEKHSK